MKQLDVPAELASHSPGRTRNPHTYAHAHADEQALAKFTLCIQTSQR
jgi:hypothetical protein